MGPDTWLIIFNSMKYIAYLGVCLYYFMPDIFVLQTPDGKPSYLVLAIVIYLFLLAVLSLIYYFQNKKTYAETVGLWKVLPSHVGQGSVLKDGQITKLSGKNKVFNEADTMEFLSESFTFGFFVSMDNSSIETVKGGDLTDKKPFQQLLVVPGAYDVFLDPLHETMRINFKTYRTNDYEVTIPTIKSRRWHQILVTIDGRTADIYQNGVLIKAVPLPNVISARPGNPYIIMNSDMYTRLALIQAWPLRLKEVDIINNYRLNTDGQGVPRYPTSTNVFGIPNLNFCVGSFCVGPAKAAKKALTHVNYEYS